MPSFDFRCKACGLVFDKFVREYKTETVPCPGCGEEAKKSSVAAVSFIFGDGKDPGNTGVHSLDYSVDKGVGRSAQERWEAIKDRESYKRSVQREHGGSSTPLRRNVMTGEYEPMSPPEVRRFQRLHGEYETLYQEHKKERENKGIPKFKDPE